MAGDRRTKLLEQKARLDAQIKALDARAQTQKRKDDTRRKIIAGALALEHAEVDAEFAGQLAALLNRYVTRTQERALFHFLDDRSPDVTPKAANTFTAVANPPQNIESALAG